MLLTVVRMGFTWPTIEALVAKAKPPPGCSITWGSSISYGPAGGVAYFTGGAILQNLGVQSLFYVPIAIQIGQLGLTLWLEHRRCRSAERARVAQVSEPAVSPTARSAEPLQLARVPVGPTPAALKTPAAAAGGPYLPIPRSRRFLRMAWLANPFAYIAINTLIAVMPGLAQRLELSTMLAGFYGSVWCFARVVAFVGLWLWPGWHYRFRWLLCFVPHAGVDTYRHAHGAESGGPGFGPTVLRHRHRA